METHTLTLIIACLGIGIGALFPPAVHAIPGDQDALVEDTQALADTPAPSALPAQTQQRAGAPDDEAGDNASAADGATVATQASRRFQPSAAIPCMQSFGDKPADSAAACAGPTPHPQPLSFQLGQRIGVNSGILDNYDGIRVDYRLSQGMKVNVLAGYADISAQNLDSAQRVLGFSADTRRFAGAWDMNTFYIQRQHEEGAISRALGGALRYLRPKRSMLVFADHDVTGKGLGALTATGAWKLHDRTTISTTADLRDGPVKYRQQKYLQQTMAATEGWNWSLPSERINYFTTARSEAVKTIAFGLSHAFSADLKLTGSAAVLDVSSDMTADSAGAASASPNEYFYNLKLTGRNVMFSGDSNILDLHHSITESTRTSSASINTRYAVNRAWNISPRLSADYRNTGPEGSVRWVTSPAVKMECRKHRYGFQLEAGGEWLTDESIDQDKSRSSYFLSLGYQATF